MNIFLLPTVDFICINLSTVYCLLPTFFVVSRAYIRKTALQQDNRHGWHMPLRGILHRHVRIRTNRIFPYIS